MPTELEALRNVLKRLEASPAALRDHAHCANLRRWLLVKIADLEDQQQDREASPDSPGTTETAA